jgi:hypothetical protein
VVDVDDEADLLGVEGLRAVDVRHRYDDDLELVLHPVPPAQRAGARTRSTSSSSRS